MYLTISPYTSTTISPTAYLFRIRNAQSHIITASSSSSSTTPHHSSNKHRVEGVESFMLVHWGSFYVFQNPLENFMHMPWSKSSTNIEYAILKEEVKKVLSKAKAAGVLRLAFHDAGTFEVDGTQGGMNGSIIYELERPENTGLRKSIKILEKAKAAMDTKQSVSWADMIAVAGAEAVSFCGGPVIPVQLGRIDSPFPDLEGKLPEETLDASGLKQCFQRKGFTTQELVALSGAHTLGSKGFGSPITFDNSYYKILLEKPWLSQGGMSTMIGLPSDHALVEDDECLRWVSKYAEDQNLFFEDFKNAYIKLVNSGARWKNTM